MHEDVSRGHRIYKEMWTSACGEVTGRLETFRRLARLRLELTLHYYLKCAYSRTSAVTYQTCPMCILGCA